MRIDDRLEILYLYTLAVRWALATITTIWIVDVTKLVGTDNTVDGTISIVNKVDALELSTIVELDEVNEMLVDLIVSK